MSDDRMSNAEKTQLANEMVERVMQYITHTAGVVDFESAGKDVLVLVLGKLLDIARKTDFPPTAQEGEPI